MGAGKTKCLNESENYTRFGRNSFPYSVWIQCCFKHLGLKVTNFFLGYRRITVTSDIFRNVTNDTTFRKCNK